MHLAQGVRYLHLPNVSSPGVPKTTSFAFKQPLGHGRNSESGKNCRKLVGTGIQQRSVFSPNFLNRVILQLSINLYLTRLNKYLKEVGSGRNLKGWVTSGTEFRKILSPLPCHLPPSSHLIRHHYSEAKCTKINTITTSPNTTLNIIRFILERTTYD